MTAAPAWLSVARGAAPLIVSIPHAGSALDGRDACFVGPWLARRDADWHIPRLYDFVRGLGATVVETALSRSLIDVNRDPSGASLYPGQATTELCPLSTFDGEPLYRRGHAPDKAEIAERRRLFFEPHHAALVAEIDRLRGHHGRVVLYDAHSIRSRIPRLFEGQLPQFNIGTNSGRSCDPALSVAVERACSASGRSFVVDGRFKGGWITRSHGAPERGAHALQMELACRGYMAEPAGAPEEGDWPTPFDPLFASPMTAILTDVLSACLDFALGISRP